MFRNLKLPLGKLEQGLLQKMICVIIFVAFV